MPDWKRFVREALSFPAMKGRRDERMVEEIADHLEAIYQEALIRGSTEAEAEQAARDWFGDPDVTADRLGRTEPHHVGAEVSRWFEGREESMHAGGGFGTAVSDAIRDLRTGVRSLARRPAFSGVVILVLALGIGAAASIFTVLDAVVLRPLAFDDAGRLVWIQHAAPGRGVGNAGQCAAWHFTYVDENHVFEDLGMFTGGRALLTGDGAPDAVPSLRVTAGVLPALRLPPVAGRIFGEEDMDPDGAPTVMLVEGYWRSRFGADPSVIGRTLQVDGEAREVIGVVPDAIRTLASSTPSLVTPLRFRRSTLFVGNIGYGAVARLRGGVTLDAAAKELNDLLPLAWSKFPGGPVASSSGPEDYVAEVLPLKDTVVGSVADILWILMGGVAVVLLIACVDVANLMLVRAEGKQAEMSVRAAMGASGRRIAWEHLKESLILGILGGALGLVLARAGLRALVGLAPANLPRLNEAGLDGRVVLFTLVVSLGAGLLFGLAPVLRHGRTSPADVLKGAGRGGPGDRGRRRVRSVSTVAQVALALVLLVASGLLLRSFQALRNVDPGFGDPADLLVARFYIPPQEIRDPAEVASTYEALVRRVGEIPGVASAAFATGIPMDGNGNVNPFYVRGRESDPEAGRITRRHKWIGGGYLETMEIPLRVGRSITWDDVHDRAPVALLSESLAREVFGSAEAALGQFVAARPEPPVWKEVVGVVADVLEDGPNQEPPKLVYWPQVTLGFWEGSSPDEVETWRDGGIVVRGARVGMPGFRAELERAVWAVDPNLPFLRVQSMPELMAGYRDRTAFTMILMGVAGGMALILGLVGVYGVVAYGVSLRTHELGMRMALGASRGTVLAMVLGQGAGLAVSGVAVGLGLAWAVTRLMERVLFGVAAVDPATYVTVAAGLLVVSVLATLLPAHRAARVDPAVALRTQ